MCCDIKSGLFGVSLKLQCFAIGSIQAVRLETYIIYSEKYEISDILMQEWKLSIKSLQQSQL